MLTISHFPAIEEIESVRRTMNEKTEEQPRPKQTLTPRLKDQEHEVVAARIPKEHAEWLLEEARKGFRGRADQIALIVANAYNEAKRGLP